MKKRIRTAVGTVIYESSNDFLQSFIQTINRQEDSEFDLLVINDNTSAGEIVKIQKSVQNDVFVLNADINSQPYQNRISLLHMAKKKYYDLLILIDFDDTMSANRVREYRKQYEIGYTFFYNNLKDDTGQNLFKILPETVKWGDILEENFLGLSNTGINLNHLSNSFIRSLSAGNTSFFDWYMYERILLEHKTGKKINNTWTEYRIHENNIAGISPDVKKEIFVKKEHYNLLQNFHEIYIILYKMYSEIDPDKFNQIVRNGYWWESIQLLEKNRKNEI